MTHDANSSKFSFNILINGVLISSNLALIKYQLLLLYHRLKILNFLCLSCKYRHEDISHHTKNTFAQSLCIYNPQNRGKNVHILNQESLFGVSKLLLLLKGMILFKLFTETDKLLFQQ